MKFGADIFIQSGVIDIFRKLKMVTAAILDLFGWAMGPPTKPHNIQRQISQLIEVVYDLSNGSVSSDLE